MSDTDKRETPRPQAQRRGPMQGGPGGGPIRMGGEKAKNFKGTMKILLGYLKQYMPLIFAVMLLSVLSSVFGIVGPKILGNGINEINEGFWRQTQGTGGINFAAVGNIALTLIALYVLSALFSFGQAFIITGVSQKVSFSLREEISRKINRLPLKYYDGVPHGEVMSRITNDVDTISQSLNQSMSQIISSVVTLVGIVIMMLTISPVMTLIVLLIMPISFGSAGAVIRKSQKHFKDQQKFLGNVNGHIEEVFSGHIVMKAFSGEEKEIAKFNEYNEELARAASKSQFLSGMMWPMMNFIGNIGYVAVVIFGGYQVISGRINVGSISAFISYIRSFNHPIMQAAQIANVLQSTAAAAERVFEFLSEEEKQPDTDRAVNPQNVRSCVEFKNIRFGYKPDEVIIKNFSAQIKEGMRVAIVGPTGAGKTTIVKLLMRFYDVSEGAVLIDGHDIRNFTRGGLRGMFGMILQDAWLFKGTVMENIRYGKISATDDEVIAAAKAAHVHRFIKTLPGGYEMELNEETSNVSQGQKQLLTIARSILTDPKILILDEATSSVDTRTEVLIQKAMANLLKGRTSFIIAHRLSTIRDADLIFVMDGGDIVEQGTHGELLGKKGLYFELYNSQFEGAG
ncbi:MAG: ABC transporter ATP-binding protein/permease [Clostridiales bacterium]|jgi:ATP-binding cassette subfamily B protein|nr:ABC transporter ATP-binding protein/permease [Clostridiales bacterium]